MRDKIFENFLRAQYEFGMALAAQSDILDLTPFPADPVWRYLVRLHAKGCVYRPAKREVAVVTGCTVGITFPPDYLRRCVPSQVLTWLEPIDAFHPNIKAPLICVGPIPAGSSLVSLLHQCFEMWTFQKATWLENDALNREACVWARQNEARLPIDARPLKRRELEVQLSPAAGG